MRNLSIYYWIKNNQRGATLRTTRNAATNKITYWASVTVNNVTKMLRINKYEYDLIKSRAKTMDCFNTHSNGRFIYHECSIRF